MEIVILSYGRRGKIYGLQAAKQNAVDHSELSKYSMSTLYKILSYGKRGRMYGCRQTRP